MGQLDQHVAQWKHNRILVGMIPVTHPDWIVTVTFYVALHAVDALLAHDGVARVHSHDTRNGVLMATRRYQQIWRHYQPLHDLSRRIRYLAEPALWVPPGEIPAQVFKRYLFPLEASVEKLLGIDLNLAEIQLVGVAKP